MAVTGNFDRILDYGGILQGMPGNEPEMPAMPQFALNSPLGGELARMNQQKAQAASRFAGEKDRGVVAAGQGLVHIHNNFDAIDSQGADAIGRLFPTPPPRPAGGQ